MSSEKSEVLYGAEHIITKTLQHFANTNFQIDACMDSIGPIVLVTTDAVWQGLENLLKRGVKGRAITQVTKDNIPYCRKLMQFAEVRHLDTVKGTFSIADNRDYQGTSTVQESKPVTQIITSTVKMFVEQQQYFFDTLWSKAIPADQKIREIEEGIVPEFIETINNPKEIQSLEMNLVKSANSELLIIFPTANTFHRQEDNGIIEFLFVNNQQQRRQQAAESNYLRGVKIRIMTPADHRIKYTADKLKEKYRQNIDIQYVQETLETTASILIVDRKLSLVVEVREDSQETANYTSIGLATYSNSKSTVLSYVSVFEGFWRQAQIYDELRESKTQLYNTQHELEDVKQYMNEVLKEVHCGKRTY